MKILDSRLARTQEDLAGFKFKIFYLPGSENTAADHLSRPYVGGLSSDLMKKGEMDKLGKLPLGIHTHVLVEGGGDSLIESLQHLSLIHI